jgi:hypothetical protein
VDVDVVADKSNDRRYFTVVPNIVDDSELDPFAFRLYVHLKRVAGENGKSTQSTTTLAKACRMSRPQIVDSKKVLVAKGLIKIDVVANPYGGRPYHEITVVDIWEENVAKFSTPKKQLAEWEELRLASAKLEDRTMREKWTATSGSKRQVVFEAGGWQCAECGHQGDEDNPLEIDHIVPICKGGTNELSNLQVLCRKCNRTKGRKLPQGKDIDLDNETSSQGCTTKGNCVNDDGHHIERKKNPIRRTHEEEHDSARESRAPTKADLFLIVKGFCDGLGIDPESVPRPTRNGYYPAAKGIWQAGYTPEQVKDCTEHLKAQPFWADKALHLAVVAKELPQWRPKPAKPNGHAPPPPDEPELTPEQKVAKHQGLLEEIRARKRSQEAVPADT